ncbi:MAG: hypothetical protein HY400_01325 [Elusimicrobia bacterium]|nr:hypothetical protein [Elusimicrobiota bacterium]
MRRIYLVALVLGFSARDLSTETLTLTTYYPAPYGVYTQLRSTRDSYLAYQGGNVGIGTNTPLTRLHVSGQSLWLTGGDSGGLSGAAGSGLRLYHDGSRGMMFAYDYSGLTSPHNLILQSPGGNVGIGELSPMYKLDVKGGIRMQGDLMVGTPPRKPMAVLTFRGSNGLVYYNTGVPYGTHFCFIGGFALPDGDIEENGTGYIARILCKKGATNWLCGGDFRSHNNNEEMRINVVCVRNELIDQSGWSNIE